MKKFQIDDVKKKKKNNKTLNLKIDAKIYIIYTCISNVNSLQIVNSQTYILKIISTLLDFLKKNQFLCSSFVTFTMFKRTSFTV